MSCCDSHQGMCPVEEAQVCESCCDITVFLLLTEVSKILLVSNSPMVEMFHENDVRNCPISGLCLMYMTIILSVATVSINACPPPE
jgi:hypothetical protein